MSAPSATSPRSRLGLPRRVVGALGVVLALLGVWLFVSDVPTSGWVRVVLWLAAGVAVHDGLVAPGAVALGRLMRGRVPARWMPAVRTGGLAALAIAILAIPLLATGGLRT